MRAASQPTLETCPNCGSAQEGRWCHHCGQKNVHARISVRTIFGDLLDQLFNVDSRIAVTLLGMTLRPGRTAREYVRGHRARYVNPLRYCFVLVALYFVVRGYFGIGIMDDLPAGLEVAETGTKQEIITTYMAQRMGRIVDWVAICAAPLFAMMIGVFFRTPQTNFAERLAFAFFAQGHSHLYGLLFLPLIPLNPTVSGTGRVTVQLAFFVWALSSFYEQEGFMAWTRALIAWGVTVLLVGFIAAMAAVPLAIRAARELSASGALP